MMKDDISRLFGSVFRNDANGVELCANENFDLDMINPASGETPLQAACEGNALASIEALLKLGADPNKRFTKISRVDGRVICSNSVALMHITSIEAASLLLRYGADTTIKDDSGLTATDWARHDSQFEIADYLESDK